MADLMVESFTCPICLEIANNAVETTCCHHVFCNDCLLLLGKKPCPQCRKNDFTFSTSHISRRIIGNLPVGCTFPGCQAQVARSELMEHQEKCNFRTFQCPGAKCVYKGNKKDFAAHLASQHEDILVQNVARCFENHENAKSKKLEDRIAIVKNAVGRVCRLGSSGKFYCGAALDGPRCRCCDGGCGPTNGCNCSACMKTDVIMRKLPKYWFVNREGAAARRSPEFPHYYCGRCVISRSNTCDGYCGPTNGPNCMACRILESQIGNRYSQVWSNP